MNRLEFKAAVREGSSSKTRVEHQCFYVDGTSLLELVNRAAGRDFDFVSPLGWGDTGHQRAAAERLQGVAEGDLPSGRVAVFICPECGDLGCGSVGVRIEEQDGLFEWSDFAYENDYNPDDTHVYEIGPFAFAAQSYLEAIDSIRRWS